MSGFKKKHVFLVIVREQIRNAKFHQFLSLEPEEKKNEPLIFESAYLSICVPPIIINYKAFTSSLQESQGLNTRLEIH
jgi:hypothetical protein